MKRPNEVSGTATTAKKPRKNAAAARLNTLESTSKSATSVSGSTPSSLLVDPKLVRRRFADEMTRLGACNLVQPSLATISIDYPEREHSSAVRRTLRVDNWDVDDGCVVVRLADDDNNSQTTTKFTVNLLEWAHARKLGYLFVKRTADNDLNSSVELCFKIPASRPEKPAHTSSLSSLVEDSVSRLGRVLDNTNTATEDDDLDDELKKIKDEPCEQSEGACKEYFKKPGLQSCPSPMIDIEMPPSSSVDCEKENTNSNNSNGGAARVKTMIKMSKKCAAGLDWPARVNQLVEFLGIQSDVDMGKLKAVGSLLAEKKPSTTIAVAPSIKPAEPLVPHRPVPNALTETSYSMQSLANCHHLCKFCESLIENVAVEDERDNIITDMDNGGSGGDKENNKLRFCSNYCRNSYKKVFNYDNLC